jgi:hypothetical protein
VFKLFLIGGNKRSKAFFSLFSRKREEKNEPQSFGTFFTARVKKAKGETMTLSSVSLFFVLAPGSPKKQNLF